MKLIFLALILILVLFYFVEGRQFAAHTRRKCIPDLALAWSREISTAPIASTPLIADVDADGDLDIVATSFSGSVHVVQAKDGLAKQTSQWPCRLNHATIHAGPLQYDIDQNGLLDLLISTSNGKLFFLTGNGELIQNKSYQLDSLMVDRDWHEKQLAVSQENIHDYILDNPSMALPNIQYLEVDPHILATGVIDDLNQDGITEELVLPVSYYFDSEEYSDPDHVTKSHNMASVEMENYLVAALLFFNLTSMTPYLIVHLDLTKITSEYPAYVLTTPTVADMVAGRPGLEIIIGTMAGHLHLIDSSGRSVEAFPVPTDRIASQVTVEDLSSDGELELIVQDSNGAVTCFNTRGSRVWETEPIGGSSFGTRLTDANGDGILDVVLASDSGSFWILSGSTGRQLLGWPVHIGQSFTGPPLITRMLHLDLTILVGLSREGTLHLLSTDTACRHSVNLGETTLVPLASHDLLPTVPGIELLVATKDGVLMCLMQGNATHLEESDSDVGDDDSLYIAWPSETKSHNDFTFLSDQIGVWFDRSEMKGVPEYTKTTFPVTITLADSMFSSPYRCEVLLGGMLLATHSYDHPGIYSMEVESPSKPLHGHLVIVCKNRMGKVLRDSIAIKFNTTFLLELQWLLICPTLATLLLLLFLYGFPAVDILPVTTPSKKR